MNSLVHSQCIDYEGGDKRLGHYVPGVGFDTTPGYMYIPSHFSNPYINGNYNIWNCMWLSHLLKGVMESLPTKLLLLRSLLPPFYPYCMQFYNQHHHNFGQHHHHQCFVPNFFAKREKG